MPTFNPYLRMMALRDQVRKLQQAEKQKLVEPGTGIGVGLDDFRGPYSRPYKPGEPTHGRQRQDINFEPEIYDANRGVWLPQEEYKKRYNTDGTPLGDDIGIRMPGLETRTRPQVEAQPLPTRDYSPKFRTPDTLGKTGFKLPDTTISDEEIMARVGSGKAAAGGVALPQIISNILASSEFQAPPQDDEFLDKMDTSVPKSIQDAENASIDANTRSVVESVLSRAPLNRAANTVAAVHAQGVGAKTDLALQHGRENIGMRNAWLQQKQASRDRYNAGAAAARNQVVDSENTRLANLGAIGANLAAERQNQENMGYALKDRNRAQRSQNAMFEMQLNRMMEILKSYGKI